jgi:hypothetical protein
MEAPSPTSAACCLSSLKWSITSASKDTLSVWKHRSNRVQSARTKMRTTLSLEQQQCLVFFCLFFPSHFHCHKTGKERIYVVKECMFFHTTVIQHQTWQGAADLCRTRKKAAKGRKMGTDALLSASLCLTVVSGCCQFLGMKHLLGSHLWAVNQLMLGVANHQRTRISCTTTTYGCSRWQGQVPGLLWVQAVSKSEGITRSRSSTQINLVEMIRIGEMLGGEMRLFANCKRGLQLGTNCSSCPRLLMEGCIGMHS